jgi:diaminobutyrate-2-oxoglutarate transaminase
VIETSGATDQVVKLLPPLTIEEARLRAGLELLERSVAAALGVTYTEASKVAFVNFGGLR